MNSDSLHTAIMNLPTRGPKGTIHTSDYLAGHRDARHAAAELVAASAAAPQGAQPVQEPAAWIEHHKGGDNLNWERVDHPYAKATPLYESPADAAPVVPQEVRMPLYGLVPPSAHEWLSNSSPPAAASTDWLSGWDACRNRVRTLVDAAMNAGLTIPAKERQHG